MSDNSEPTASAPIVADPPAPVNTVARLGRLRATDPRDRRYSMPAPPSVRTFRNWLSPGPIWDQGHTSQCVAYSTNRFLVTLPIVNHPPMALDRFYHECQLADEWPGEDYDGTSVRAAFKVLKTIGLVSVYSWATEPEQVIRHLLEHGPVVLGVDWTDEMFDPDVHGYIWPKGPVVGGHAFMLSAVNRQRLNPDGTVGAVRMLNSWGQGWADNGKAWMSFGTLDKLMAGLEGFPGDAATATELKTAV